MFTEPRPQMYSKPIGNTIVCLSWAFLLRLFTGRAVLGNHVTLFCQNKWSEMTGMHHPGKLEESIMRQLYASTWRRQRASCIGEMMKGIRFLAFFGVGKHYVWIRSIRSNGFSTWFLLKGKGFKKWTQARNPAYSIRILPNKHYYIDKRTECS